MHTTLGPLSDDFAYELGLVDQPCFGDGVKHLIGDRCDTRPDVSQLVHVVAQISGSKKVARHPCEATGEDSAATKGGLAAGEALFVVTGEESKR